MAKKLSTSDVVEQFKLVHGDKYDYSFVEYQKNAIKVKIVCPEHGPFMMTPNNHKNGQKCPVCSGQGRGKSQRLSLVEALRNMKAVHAGKYDYSEVLEYKNAHKKLRIKCPEHGLFMQSYHKHRGGQGCPVCAGNVKKEPKEAIEKLKAKHPEYDYSISFYSGSSKTIKVICPEHGVFEPFYKSHLKGTKCPSCMNIKRLTTLECVEGFKSVWGDLYDYGKVNYVDTKTHVSVVCRTHGEFLVTPNNHKKGHGCPMCRLSKGEKLIGDHLDSIGAIYESQKKLSGMAYKGDLRCDFYLPHYNAVIEFNGRQHYEPVAAFGGITEFAETQLRDAAKVEYCYKNNIELLILSYKDKRIKERISAFLDSIPRPFKGAC